MLKYTLNQYEGVFVKLRRGFVSNSSSASFIVEVKGDTDDILWAMYENIEAFQEESYKELLLESISFEEKKFQNSSMPEYEKKFILHTIEEAKNTISYLDSYVKPSWSDFEKIKDTEEKEFALWKEKDHGKSVVRGVLGLKRWHCSTIDDGYVSFSDSTLMYNGWENIAPRKTLLEVLSFFTFMRYSVRTRIESDL
mgnify:FL=1